MLLLHLKIFRARSCPTSPRCPLGPAVSGASAPTTTSSRPSVALALAIPPQVSTFFSPSTVMAFRPRTFDDDAPRNDECRLFARTSLTRLPLSQALAQTRTRVAASLASRATIRVASSVATPTQALPLGAEVRRSFARRYRVIVLDFLQLAFGICAHVGFSWL